MLSAAPCFKNLRTPCIGFTPIPKLMIMPLMTTTFIEHKLQDKSLLRTGYVQSYLTLMMLRGKQAVQERNGFIKVTQSEEAGGAGFKPQPSVSLMQLLQVAFLCVLCAVSKPRRGRDCSGRATTISSASPCNGTAQTRASADVVSVNW